MHLLKKSPKKALTKLLLFDKETSQVFYRSLGPLFMVSIHFLPHALTLLGDQSIHSFWCGPVVANRFKDDMEN